MRRRIRPIMRGVPIGQLREFARPFTRLVRLGNSKLNFDSRGPRVRRKGGVLTWRKSSPSFLCLIKATPRSLDDTEELPNANGSRLRWSRLTVTGTALGGVDRIRPTPPKLLQRNKPVLAQGGRNLLGGFKIGIRVMLRDRNYTT